MKYATTTSGYGTVATDDDPRVLLLGSGLRSGEAPAPRLPDPGDDDSSFSPPRWKF